MRDEVERRASILAAARARYAEAEPASVSMRQVARDAGVSVALVYHYFSDKSALYDACLEGLYEEVAELAREGYGLFAAGGDLSAALDEIVRRSFRFASENHPWVSMLQRAVTERGGLDSQRREQFQKPFLTVAAQAASMATGRPEREMRLALQSVVLLIVRHSLSSPEEREAFVGEGVDDPTSVVEDHLVAMAQRMILDSGHAPPR
jgi:AcrR family transcriptional regulator